MIIYRNANGIKKVLTRNHFRQFYSGQKPTYPSSNKIQTLTNSFEWDLPIEIWTKILTKLSYKDRLTCRSVSWKWRQILSSFFEFRNDRILPLQNCVLDLDEQPMETFSQTTFMYEILRVGGNVTIVGYKEISDFLKKIGKEMREIQILLGVNVFELVDLFENGLRTENFPKLETLQIEKSNIFGSMIQESENFRGILEKRVQHLRFESLVSYKMSVIE